MAVAQQQSEIGEDKKEWRGGLSVIAIHGVRLGEEVGVRPGRPGEEVTDYFRNQRRFPSRFAKQLKNICFTLRSGSFRNKLGPEVFHVCLEKEASL